MNNPAAGNLTKNGWVTKVEAAAITGLSMRTIERLASTQKIQRAWRRVPGRKPLIVIHPDDVERLRQETAASAAFTTSHSENGAAPENAIITRSPSGETVDVKKIAAVVFEQLIAKSARPAVEIKDKIFLRMNEASEISGLPTSYLRAAVRDGRLEAIKTGGGWRIRRASLEQL